MCSSKTHKLTHARTHTHTHTHKTHAVSMQVFVSKLCGASQQLMKHSHPPRFRLSDELHIIRLSSFPYLNIYKCY